jgi:hypothetical protein
MEREFPPNYRHFLTTLGQGWAVVATCSLSPLHCTLIKAKLHTFSPPDPVGSFRTRFPKLEATTSLTETRTTPWQM